MTAKGGLSARTVRYIHTITGKAVGDAVNWDRISRNPAERAKPPRPSDGRPPEMRTWDAATLNCFLELEVAKRYRPAWLFLATTAVRRGEALGLRWQDVDLERARASIRHTITAIDHKIHSASRTKADRPRVIELDATTVAELRSWRVRQAREKLAMGAGYGDVGLVFCHPDGRPYHPDRFSREFDRRVARYALYRIRLHDLRHTWATLALEAGIPAKVVSERLGHASIAITLDTYSHVTLPMASDAAEKVAAVIFGTQ